MRKLLLGLLFASPAAFGAPLDDAKNLAAAGAPQLAFDYLKKHEPSEPAAWESWAGLQLDLSAKAGEAQETLTLAERVSPKSKLAAKAWMQGAKAAEKLGQYEVERRFLSRLAWGGFLSAAELKRARFAIIGSYFLQKDGKDGYLAWLRYRQDYGAPSKPEALSLASWMMGVKMEKEAVDFLPLIDENNMVGLLLRLRTGLASPQEVEAKLTPQAAAAHLEAALLANDAAGEIAAREQLAKNEGIGTLPALYSAYALQYANEAQLLQGDDAFWFSLSAKEAGTPESRALLYYLGEHAADAGARVKAKLSLLTSLIHAGLPAVALALYPDAQDAGLKMALGRIAFESGNYPAALAFWRGLPLSGNDLLDEALAAASAGQDGEAPLFEFLQGKSSLDPSLSAKALAVAKRLATSGKTAAIGKLLPLLDPSLMREGLIVAAQALSSSDPKAAATDFILASGRFLPGDFGAVLYQLKAAELLSAAGSPDGPGIYRSLLAKSRDPALKSYLKGKK